MKKILFLLILLGGIFYAFVSFGAVSYSRSPAGSNTTSPITINIISNSYEELCLFPNENWYVIILDNVGGDDRISNPIASTTLSTSVQFSLPVGYQAAEVATNCSGDSSNDVIYETGNPAFTIISTDGDNNYLLIPANSGVDLLALAGGLFSDLWVLIAIAIGLPLAFYIIKKVISLISKR
jgi:hypothetical protein